jgi:hypothetical protein
VQDRCRAARTLRQFIVRTAEDVHADAERHLTVEEAERGNWGDIQVELEEELWRLE